MFNPNKAYNDLPLIPPEINYQDIDILQKTIEATTTLGELKGHTFNLPNSNLLIEPLSIKEAVASSNIENIMTTVEEAFQAQLFYEKEISKPQKETLHYKEALRIGYESIVKNNYLDTNTIIKIQSVLEPGKSGIRKIPNVTIRNETTNEIIYTPPQGESKIRDLLKNFEDFFNKNEDGIDVLTKLAILHYQFEAIHPFLDGNGRTGRILMVLYLVHTSRLIAPTLFLSGYINDNRNRYYELIKNVTEKGEWKEWILFILEAVKMQALITRISILDIMDLKRKTKAILKEVLPKKMYSADLLDFLFSSPFYTQKSFADYLRKHQNTAGKTLNLLVEKKILTTFNYKKYKMYCYDDFLKLLK